MSCQSRFEAGVRSHSSRPPSVAAKSCLTRCLATGCSLGHHWFTKMVWETLGKHMGNYAETCFSRVFQCTPSKLFIAQMDFHGLFHCDMTWKSLVNFPEKSDILIPPGSASFALDFLRLGFSSLVRSSARVSSAPSVCKMGKVGSLLLVLDFVQLDLSMLLRSRAHLGFLLLILSFLHVGFLVSLRSFAQLGFFPFLLDLAHMGLSLFMRSMGHLEVSVLVPDFAHTGLILSLHSHACLDLMVPPMDLGNVGLLLLMRSTA